MPVKKYGAKRAYRKKAYRGKRVAKRKRMSKPTTAVMRGPNGFPDRIRVKMAYYASFNASQSSGVAVLQQYRGNSVFDPDYTLTGHQPTSFDQWKAFYGRYRVHGSAIRIISVLPGNSAMSGTNTVGQICIVAPSIDTGTLAETDIAEMAYSKSKASTYYTPIRELRSYMSSAKILGVSKRSIEDEDDNTAPTNAAPLNSWFWNVLVVQPGLTTTVDYSVTVKLTYYTEMYSRINIGTS